MGLWLADAPLVLASQSSARRTLLTAAGAFDRRSFSRIVIDPTDANIVYAAVASGVNGALPCRSVMASDCIRCQTEV